ncbi:MAG: HAD family hydrolase [Ignavibacteria bacterium]
MQNEIKAVLFDVDGTLYNQNKLRVIIAITVILSCIIFPFTAIRKLKVIKHYRMSQETLRQNDNLCSDLGAEQIRLTAEKTGIDVEKVKMIVSKWFEEVPLIFLPLCKKKDLYKTFKNLFLQNIQLGLFSDYPSQNKAKALKLDAFITSYVCSTDPDVGKFKPDPKGFIKSSEKMGIPVINFLYVGDRAEVDVVGANLSGMDAVLIGKLPENDKRNYSIRELNELENIIKLKNE